MYIGMIRILRCEIHIKGNGTVISLVLTPTCNDMHQCYILGPYVHNTMIIYTSIYLSIFNINVFVVVWLLRVFSCRRRT